MNAATTTPTALGQPPLNLEAARQHLRQLGLYGLLAQAQTLLQEPWLARVIDIEDAERARRSLKRRLDDPRLGAFKPLADFDWDWPERCDRALVEELFSLNFVEEAALSPCRRQPIRLSDETCVNRCASCSPLINSQHQNAPRHQNDALI